MHFGQLQQHGGEHGIREQGTLLEAALARPRNKFHYQPDADLADFAAAYAFAITKTSHPFNDGNKRAGFVAAAVFLELNGYQFRASDASVVDAIMAIASGRMTEAQLAAWLRGGLHPIRAAAEPGEP